MKKQKMPAENFPFEVSSAAGTLHPEKFIRPDLVERGYCTMAYMDGNANS